MGPAVMPNGPQTIQPSPGLGVLATDSNVKCCAGKHCMRQRKHVWARGACGQLARRRQEAQHQGWVKRRQEAGPVQRYSQALSQLDWIKDLAKGWLLESVLLPSPNSQYLWNNYHFPICDFCSFEERLRHQNV